MEMQRRKPISMDMRHAWGMANREQTGDCNKSYLAKRHKFRNENKRNILGSPPVVKRTYDVKWDKRIHICSETEPLSALNIPTNSYFSFFSLLSHCLTKCVCKIMSSEFLRLPMMPSACALTIVRCEKDKCLDGFAIRHFRKWKHSPHLETFLRFLLQKYWIN